MIVARAREGLVSKVDHELLDGPEAPVLRESGGKTVNPFRFLSLGVMAYLGNDRAGKLCSVVDRWTDVLVMGKREKGNQANFWLFCHECALRSNFHSGASSGDGGHEHQSRRANCIRALA